MLVGTPFDPQATAPAATAPVSLDAFLAGIGPRAFRFAEAGLRHREDALDAVQDAMVKLLGYRERPAEEWTPLFWSILRSRIIDLQRRRSFRLKFWAPAERADDEGPIDWADPGTGPVDEHSINRPTTAGRCMRTLPARQREPHLRVLETWTCHHCQAMAARRLGHPPARAATRAKTVRDFL
nr:RNA polymerase sigma factor [Xanthomonas citri]